jgi:transposase-like protein
LVHDYPLKHTLRRLGEHGQLFDQLRQALQIAPLNGDRGLNHEGEPVAMKTLQQQVEAFAQQVRTRPDYLTTPALQKMIRQLDHYGPKLFAEPLVVQTPLGPRTIQPQRTNNILERFFRNLKRDYRHKSGCHSLGRAFRAMLPDTTLVKNLENQEYLKILLDGHSTLEALFAELDPVTVRQELTKARCGPERVPRPLQRFISQLPDLSSIKNIIKNAPSNRVS